MLKAEDAMMKLHRNRVTLTQRHMKSAARRLQVDVPTIQALLEVESRNSGFDNQGRVMMLFEPHVFYRELNSFPKARAEAVEQGIAYARWGAAPYPRDSYPRFEQAVHLCRKHQIAEAKAIRSASWGLAQIMGFNHRAAGFETPEDMFAAFQKDEGAQLNGMISFILSQKLDEALRQQDWSSFARGYNGAGFAKHGYHTKLAAAYRKYQHQSHNDPMPADWIAEMLHRFVTLLDRRKGAK